MRLRVLRPAVISATLALSLTACASPSQPGPTTSSPVPEAKTVLPASTPISIPPDEETPPQSSVSPGIPTTLEASSPSGHLETEGPYIAYLKADGSAYSAELRDIYGDGHVTYPLPHEAEPQLKFDLSPVNLISSSGEYFAYYTGNEEPPFDLQLRVIRLQDGSQTESIPLLAADMDAAMEALAEDALAQHSDDFAGIPEELVPEELLFSLQTGIRAYGWSPIADKLAFASQANGPSSDLYVVIIPDGAIARLTSGPQNIQRLSWSPDGRWIAHGSAFVSGLGSSISNYIVSRDGATLLDLPDGGLIEGGWSTSDWYFLHEAGHGSGDNALKVVHVPDPVFLPVWPASFTSYAFDVPNETAAVSRYFSDQGDPGTYLSTTRGNITEDIPIPLLTLVAWGRGPNRFAGSGDEGVFAITTQGEAVPLFDEPRRISISPDNDHLALYDPRGDGPTVLFSASSGQTTEVTKMPVDCVLWSPDSSAFFFVSSRTLYSFALGGLAPELLDQRLLDQSCPMKVVGLY